MITIPTSEFVTVLSGALAFTPVIKDDPMRGVLVQWDGETLHVSAYDVLSGVRVSWQDGAGREGIETDDDADQIRYGFRYGGDDAPWKAFISFDDAKDLVKVFKLASKFWWIPVALKIVPSGKRLIVERSREFGKSEATLIVQVDTDVTSRFPDISDIAGGVLGGQLQMQTDIAFAPHRLAAYGAIQIGETLTLRFGTEGNPTVIRMGSRVTGFAYPAGTHRSEVAAQAVGLVSGGKTDQAETIADERAHLAEVPETDANTDPYSIGSKNPMQV